MSNQCGVYKFNPLLKGSRTQADLDAIDTYCNYAMNFNYGPNPTNERVNQPACNCPFGYGYNGTAYNFQSGPEFINLNQSLNFQKQQQMKGGFRGNPNGPSTYSKY
jgi:hypothetical protein